LAYGGLKREYFNETMNYGSNRQVSEGYGGHIMYNQELWILPLVSMFNMDMSKNIINSRLRRGLNADHVTVFEQARENARLENNNGLRYPWEQGDYGVDVSPYQDARKSKIHTSADISFGLRSFLRMTHSKEFLLQSVSNDVSVRGEDYLHELAKYWFDKFELSSDSRQYEIRGVSFGERPQSREVNNEAFTNHMATLALDTYKYALQLSDK
jgi:trehalose/maltose hydrolase-like predicted phosphorylase